MLDPTGGNTPIVLKNITDVIVVQADGTQTLSLIHISLGYGVALAVELFRRRKGLARRDLLPHLSLIHI